MVATCEDRRAFLLTSIHLLFAERELGATCHCICPQWRQDLPASGIRGLGGRVRGGGGIWVVTVAGGLSAMQKQAGRDVGLAAVEMSSDNGNGLIVDI